MSATYAIYIKVEWNRSVLYLQNTVLKYDLSNWSITDTWKQFLQPKSMYLNITPGIRHVCICLNSIIFRLFCDVSEPHVRLPPQKKNVTNQ